MTSLSDDNQADIIEPFNSTCRHLDIFYLLTILSSKEWSTIYPPELQLNKANT